MGEVPYQAFHLMWAQWADLGVTAPKLLFGLLFLLSKKACAMY